MKEFLKKELYSFRAVAAILARWLLLAVPTGLVCGAVGTAFHLAVEHVTEWRVPNSAEKNAAMPQAVAVRRSWSEKRKSFAML